MPLHAFPGQGGSQRSAVMRTNTAVLTSSHTGSASAHTYLATWTELVASTAYDAVGFMLRCNTATAASAIRSDRIVQLGIGAVGSEQVVMESPQGFKSIGNTICLPLFIPAGSRIAVRHKGFRTNLVLAFSFDYYGSPNRDMSGLPTRWVCYGMVETAQSSGTAVTAGNTNAWGAWTALTTNTTYPHELWVPVIDAGTASGSTALNYRSQFSIASTTDAANSLIVDGPLWRTTTAEQMEDNLTVSAGTWVTGDGRFRPNGPIYAPRAAGAAVSMRAMCSATAEATVAGSILAAVM